MKNIYKNIIGLILLNLITITSYSQYNNAFRIRITGNGYSDETVIRLVNGATQNFDGMYDAWKLFSSNPNVPSIYTQVAPGQELSINSLPEFSEDKSVTIYTNVPVSGTYTIDVEEIYAVSANYKVSFTNLSSNNHARLMGDTSLVFNLNAQQNTPTFTFNISTPLVSSVTDETCSAMNDGTLEINNSGNTDWDIEITDDNTNIVLNSTSNTAVNNYTNLTPGNYTAKVSSLGIEDVVNFTINAAVSLTADFNLDKDTIYISTGGEVNITNTSLNAQTYSWDMGDGSVINAGNPTYAYSAIGNYQIELTASNTNCTSQNTKAITVLLSPAVVTSINNNNTIEVKLANFGNGKYQLITPNFNTKQVYVYDIKGSLIFQDNFNDTNYGLSLANNANGIYLLNVIDENGKAFQEKLVR